MTERLRLALVFGGRSGEHEVSVVSARSVSSALRAQRYEVKAMAIDHDGLWADAETAASVLDGSGDRADQVLGFTGRHRLDPRLLDGDIDVVIPMLHGPYGEDGTIQGLCEMLGLPYVGCNVAASAVAMSKIYSKRLLAQAGLPTADWLELHRDAWQTDAQDLRRRCLELGLPVFVKPARLGSSVGISKVAEPAQLGPAIELALIHDDQVLVEQGLAVRELEIAVLGNQQPRASLPGEVVPGREFYDYADKYLESGCQLLAPAPLSEAQTAAVQALAIKVYRCLGCDSMARVDLFLDRETGSLLWANEANTIPGFTSISMYPRLWQLSGLAYPDLLDELVNLALARFQQAAQRSSQRLQAVTDRSPG